MILVIPRFSFDYSIDQRKESTNYRSKLKRRDGAVRKMVVFITLYIRYDLFLYFRKVVHFQPKENFHKH